MRYYLFLVPLILWSPGQLFSQKTKESCCAIIDMDKENRTFTLRDRNTGRITVFKPDALEGADLRVGDEVNASMAERKTLSIKGAAKIYALTEPEFGDPCCMITIIEPGTGEPSVTLVTAKNISSEEQFRFNVPRSMAVRLNIGGAVFKQPTHGYAMVPASLTDTSGKYLYGFPMLQQPVKHSN
jgi:hypothetical protein